MPDWDDVVATCEAALPQVERSASYGTPALKVKGKLFARHHQDGEHLVVFADFLEREALIEADPSVYVVTNHYREHPMMLIKLDAVSDEALREALIESWCRQAPKRLLAEYEARSA